MFGELPAWALYVRHVKGLTLSNVRFSLRDTDFRPAFVFDDTKGVIMKEVTPSEEKQIFGLKRIP